MIKKKLIYWCETDKKKPPLKNTANVLKIQ